MKRLHYIALCMVLSFTGSIPLKAQLQNFKSESYIGLMLGGSYYIGDLNPFGHFNKRTGPSATLIYKYHINSRLEARGTFSYGHVAGSDADAKDASLRARNLSFHSDIFELAGGIEFNYLNYRLGNTKYFFSPYLFIEAAIFRMDPRTTYKGEMVHLQTIGTEGQNSKLSNKKSYPLIQFAIPFGIGFKFNLGHKAAIALEYGLRKTFTDYLDDVGSGDFIDKKELAKYNGNIAAELSDRSNPGYKMTGKRGNPATKDWYSMFGISFIFSLGKGNTCFY